METKARTPELWKQIPSTWFTWPEIYDEAVATAPRDSILVEIGSFWGQSCVYLAESAKIADKGLKVYCVDLFDMRPENNPPLFDVSLGGAEAQIHAQFHQSQFETFAHFVDSTRLSPDPLRVMRMSSLEAAEMFNREDQYNLHFVFLDGDHEYSYVLAELQRWARLIWRPGIIAGDDWTPEFWGVQKAVEEYFGVGVAEVKGKSWIVRL